MYFGDFKIDTRKWNLRKGFPKCISFAILRVSNKGEKVGGKRPESAKGRCHTL